MNYSHIRVRCEDPLQRRDQILVKLHCHHFVGSNSQVTCQTSQPRTDFQHGVCWFDLGYGNNLFQCLWVLQEILPQSLMGAQAVAFEQRLSIQ